jgi:hypothetical protein
VKTQVHRCHVIAARHRDPDYAVSRPLVYRPDHVARLGIGADYIAERQAVDEERDAAHLEPVLAQALGPGLLVATIKRNVAQRSAQHEAAVDVEVVVVAAGDGQVPHPPGGDGGVVPAEGSGGGAGGGAQAGAVLEGGGLDPAVVPGVEEQVIAGGVDDRGPVRGGDAQVVQVAVMTDQDSRDGSALVLPVAVFVARTLSPLRSLLIATR